MSLRTHARLLDWWHGISLRTKITAVTVLVMTFGLALSGFGVVTVLRGYLVNDDNMQLVQTLRSVNSQTVSRDQAAVATQFAFAHFETDGQLIQANPPWSENTPDFGAAQVQQVASSQINVSTVRDPVTGADSFQVATKRLDDGTVVALALPLSGVDRLIAQLFTLFFLFGLVVIILGAILTRLLVDSTFEPLRQVERTAAAIAAGDFGQRLGTSSPKTEVGRLNRSLNRMLNHIDGALADRARTIDQMRRFVGDASHELRTPLVTVRGYAELYRMGALQSKEDVNQAMDRIEKEAVRLGTLVADLLALARLDERREMKRTPVELLPLAHDAALDARALAPQRFIKVLAKAPDEHAPEAEVLPPATSSANDGEAALTTSSLRLFRRRARQVREDAVVEQAARDADISNEHNPIVLGEEDRLRQVLTNLIANAIRYTPETSPIEVAAYCEPKRDTAVIEVIDHGEGIPPQTREKIFERFWRADSSRTRDTGGSGLGLSIVAAIVQAHGGTVGIFETPGGGATFRVVLPLWHDEAKSAVGEEV